MRDELDSSYAEPARVPGYRERVRCGERVRLPDGRNGSVYMIERDVGGCAVVVSVNVEGAKPKLFGLIKPKPVRFADGEIDLLEPIPTEAEIKAIMDDPSALGLEP